MSTRAVIARKTKAGFAGVYHHWDGYPSGLGATLFEVRNKFYAGDTERMLKFLIDAHPGGWSTINKDWSKPLLLSRNDEDELCVECKLENWRHYRQYYHGGYSPVLSGWERAGRPSPPPGEEVLVLGHAPKHSQEPTGPEPHGGAGGQVDESNASDYGCEWAYVFDGNGKLEVQCSYCNPRGKHSGQKMIGAFGCGDPKAIWKAVATVNLDGQEPDWKALDNRA